MLLGQVIDWSITSCYTLELGNRNGLQYNTYIATRSYMTIQVGQQIKVICTQRRAKAYAVYGRPAIAGEQGIVTRINDMRDVCIVQFDTNDGDSCYCHIQYISQ
jgi:hypothetical protein